MTDGCMPRHRRTEIMMSGMSRMPIDREHRGVARDLRIVAPARAQHEIDGVDRPQDDRHREARIPRPPRAPDRPRPDRTGDEHHRAEEHPDLDAPRARADRARLARARDTARSHRRRRRSRGTPPTSSSRGSRRCAGRRPASRSFGTYTKTHQSAASIATVARERQDAIGERRDDGGGRSFLHQLLEDHPPGDAEDHVERREHAHPRAGARDACRPP